MEAESFGMQMGVEQKQKPSASAAQNTSQKVDEEDTKPSVVDEIREMGFSAYVKEIQIRKMEELREKILEAMGLSEEQLQEMPAEQRNQIEDMIAEEIRRRMMAASTINSGVPLTETLQPDTPATKGNIQNNMHTGLALLQAIEQSSVSGKPRSEDENG